MVRLTDRVYGGIMPRMPRRPGRRWLLLALGRRMPRIRGELRVDGLHAAVTIQRDRWGIPYVTASNDADAWFGLGFCHGQDRGFQLELVARAGRGSLSELLGAEALPLDRLSRSLGFARMARAQLAVLDQDIRDALDGYVAGVNAAIVAGPRPHELVLLRRRATRWIPEDVLAFLGLQSLALSGNWDTELGRLQILLADGPDALAAAAPAYPAWLPTHVPAATIAGASFERLAEDLARLRDVVGGAGASNAWALAPQRTATGAPILANDPHLAPTVPAPWYLARLRTPDWSVAGASFVGGPAFPSGHNGHVAWGITAACTDSADLFWERLDLAAGTAAGPRGPEPIHRITERISVRGADDVVEEVVVTARGPVITPLLDLDAALSLRATWLEPVPVRGFLDVHRTDDFASFRRAFAAWPGPGLNVVYADAGGHIGWQLVGTLPRRRAGHGTLPLPAWDPEVGWEAQHLPFDDLPWVRDPEPGFVVSANHAAWADRDERPFLGADWLDGYRAARLIEAIGQRSTWDVAATMALQADRTSMPWRELRDPVLAAGDAAAVDADAHTGIGLLREWDGVVGPGTAAASVYELLVSELAAALARTFAPTAWRAALGGGVGPALPRTTLGAVTVSRVVRAVRDGTLGEVEILAALTSATRMLGQQFGWDTRRWAWGRVRPLRLRHPLGVGRPLDAILNLGPVAIGGDTHTVAQGGVGPLAPLGDSGAIPNHRTVIDLADPDRSRYVVAGGQSGNPVSPHYADLFALWRREEGVPIAWSPDAVRAVAREVMLLRPRHGAS
jgi:penicillin amidase